MTYWRFGTWVLEGTACGLKRRGLFFCGNEVPTESWDIPLMGWSRSNDITEEAKKIEDKEESNRSKVTGFSLFFCVWFIDYDYDYDGWKRQRICAPQLDTFNFNHQNCLPVSFLPFFLFFFSFYLKISKPWLSLVPEFVKCCQLIPELKKLVCNWKINITKIIINRLFQYFKNLFNFFFNFTNPNVLGIKVTISLKIWGIERGESIQALKSALI